MVHNGALDKYPANICLYYVKYTHKAHVQHTHQYTAQESL